MIMAGGLGNQLFQLYAGVHYASKSKRTLVLDYSQFYIGYTKRSERISKEILQSINYPITISDEKYFISARIILDQTLLRLMRILGTSSFFWRGRSSEIGYSANFDSTKKSKISGYFQTWRHYSALIESNYISDIHLQNPSEEFTSWDSRIRAENPIVVHIRRGDYLSLSENWGLLGFEYFNDAITSLIDNNFDHKILVFSDEPELAKLLLEHCLFKNVEYFPTGSLKNDFEEMMLMGLSDKIVISNSTFSWWSAQLGQTKHVVAPEKWFRGMDDPIDLIPNSWTRVRSSWEHINESLNDKISDKANVQIRVKESD